MKFELEFDTDNAAFDDPTEIQRLLGVMSQRIGEGETSGSLFDINGNRIGFYEKSG